MSVRFNNNQSRGDDASESRRAVNAVNGESDETILFERQLSRPRDHYRHRNAKTDANNPYAPPPKHSGHYLSNFFREPIATSLSTFSRVTNVLNDEDWISTLNLIRPPGYAERVSDRLSAVDEELLPSIASIPPPLPSIACSQHQNRLQPLNRDEYESNYANFYDQLLQRVFKGGICDNELRRHLWPIILGITNRIEQEFDWTEHNLLFEKYYNQWNSILADQETRFTAYRERKSLIERDVIRCDRTHTFYKGTNDNLEKLRSLLLTYTMYDFDTGYVQGMSDLASPILYVMDGDVMKAFWCFVQVMKLIGRNFEMSQSAIKYQLEMLWKLIELTDPCFATYLANKDSTNCYFAFRWIVCQFKREFMKTEDDDYDDCLILWESIWTASIMRNTEKLDESNSSVNGLKNSIEENVIKKEIKDEAVVKVENSDKHDNNINNNEIASSSSCVIEKENSCLNNHENKKESNNSNSNYKSLEKRLTDVELYTLSICLSIIRRERDLIMAQQFDATDILKHFNTLQLNNDLHNILLHASTIWYWLTHDCGESLLYYFKESEQHNETTEDYDLLNEVVLSGEDYYIINAGNI